MRSLSDELQTSLGHRFDEPGLLHEALTHASTTGSRARRTAPTSVTNQRLEFLGDRVLGLVVADLLIEAYPDAAEGALTKRSQVLVSRETLAAVADELQLRAHVRMVGMSERGSFEPTPKMCADACEAIIGALYRDGGLHAAARFVRRYWQHRVAAMVEPPHDPKMALQEWALARAKPLPSYVELARSGPAHAPRFRVQALVEGAQAVEADGRSKRLAEQAAARRLLQRLQDSEHG